MLFFPRSGSLCPARAAVVRFALRGVCPVHVYNYTHYSDFCKVFLQKYSARIVFSMEFTKPGRLCAPVLWQFARRAVHKYSLCSEYAAYRRRAHHFTAGITVEPLGITYTSLPASSSWRHSSAGSVKALMPMRASGSAGAVVSIRML